MTKPTRILAVLLSTLILNSSLSTLAQESLSILDDYASEMQVGNDRYQYSFSKVDGNECKLKVTELFTDKKGNKKSSSWIFYLSDMDPAKISFKAKGKSIVVSMETFQSQEFISYFESEELKGYTEEVQIIMNEVEAARSFIETIKERVKACKEIDLTWDSRDQAFNWLRNNIGPATDEKTEWNQTFEQGLEEYLVDFQVKTLDDNGNEEILSYIFDLSDINPSAVKLKISGKLLMVEVPVKEGKKFIEERSPAGSVYTNELAIQTNEIELARQIVNALLYVLNNTTPERPQWDSYEASLGFVKQQLGEVQIGDELFTNVLSYESSNSGKVELVIGHSEPEGATEAETYSFYLADMADQVNLEVSKSSITLEMLTKNKREYIRQSKDGLTMDYTSSLEVHMPDIDQARNILLAFEQAIAYSEESLTEFTSIEEVKSWFSTHLTPLEAGGDTYEPRIQVNEDFENQLVIENTLTDKDGSSTESRHILYPGDIDLDELDIKTSGSKLAVAMASRDGKLIKYYKNDLLQNFTSTVEVPFLDPLEAKNFMAAIRFLKEKVELEERSALSKEEAMGFLSTNIQTINSSSDQFEQQLEMSEEGNCKVSFTRVETDKKGASDTYLYEFNVADIDAASSKFSVKGEMIHINLVSTGNQKLIKPYKNGEADDFIDDFIIYVDDVLLAKKTLAAFKILSDGCK